MTEDTSYRTHAEMYADLLLDKHSEVADTLEGVRMLIAMAWLEGSLRGSDEAMTLLRRELEKTARA